VVAFNEQNQHIEKSKASVVKVVSCFATVKARIQVRKSDTHTKPSQISTKKIQRRQDRDCYLFRSDVSVLYMSAVAHLAKQTPLFAAFECLDLILPFANN